MREKMMPLVLAAFATLLPSSASAQTTPLYRFNCTTQTWPACGLTLVPDSQYVRRTLRLGAGPQGQNASEWDHVPQDHQFQYYFGWGTPGGLSSVPQGAARYLRMRIRVLSPVDLRGNQGPWQAKFFIVGDGTGDSTSRIVGHFGVGGVNDVDVYTGASRNIDGYPNAAPGVLLSPNVWHSVQYEFKSSTTGSSGDGRMRIWLDGANANFNSSTTQSGSFQLNTTGWNTIAIGRISHTTLSPGGRIVYQIATDWEWDDQFDAAWHQGGGEPLPPAPAPPTNVHIIRSSLELSAPLLIATMLWRRHRRRSQA
jgi:hypothetical protein